MLKAARAHGSPMIVIAMMMAATTQPNAIQAPPSTIQRTFRNSETGDMAHFYRAGNAIEIENAVTALIQIRTARELDCRGPLRR
jgi:hypothetical protein